MEAEIIATEYHGNDQFCSWLRANTGRVVFESGARGSSKADWVRILIAAFLPDGYPTSVTGDYLAFQMWDSLQALCRSEPPDLVNHGLPYVIDQCSYIRGMLSSQAILVGIGLGKEAATPTAAVFQFLMRDLSGMLGGTAFAFLQGSDLDSHAKQWRLFADIFNNIAYALELASPLVPGAFLLLACLGSIARAITGMAGSATRAALTHHFARAGNAADVSAKEGSQETATTLVGMLLGMLLLHLSAGSTLAAWSMFLLLTALHIYANVRAMRALRLTSLNAPRLQMLLSHALQHVRPSLSDCVCVPTRQVHVAEQGGEILSPSAVAAREGLLAPPLRRLLQALHPEAAQFEFGARLSAVAVPAEVEQLCTSAHNEMYIIKQRGGIADIAVILRQGASQQDVLQAFAHGWILLCKLSDQAGTTARQQADDWMREQWPMFLRALLQGDDRSDHWTLHNAALGPSKWRASWGDTVKQRSQ